MCGITGFVDFKHRTAEQHVKNATDSLQHRGPNDSDVILEKTVCAGVGLGHRRLSILDLSQLGHQPMYSEDRQVAIVFNGEVYNFKEIRHELEQNGHSFKSNSDTEVIIRIYQEEGITCVNRFIGMFAIAIYDIGKQKLFLIRDRPGIKPLHYYYEDGCLLFASELKAFHSYPVFKKEIDHTALSSFFKYGYIKAPHSIFKHAFKLLPGHYAELDLQDQSFNIHQYWNVLDYYNQPVLDVSEKEAIDHLDDICTKAFQYRMVSDVPVGVFLSGGYDSSLLTAVLQKNSENKIKTFTIGFNEPAYNEADHAKKVAGYLGTDHHEYYCTIKEAQEIIPQLPFYYDEPFGDSSAIPTILVSRFAKQHVTVALSADGGDEIFAGYTRYDQLAKMQKIKDVMPRLARKAATKFIQTIPAFGPRYQKMAAMLSEKDLLTTSDLLNSHFSDTELQQLLKGNLQGGIIAGNKLFSEDMGFINSLLAIDWQTYMVDDILTKVDRATMSVGLEGREPLLDHHIIEWVARLPHTMKYNNGNKKHLLKELTHRYLPQSIMDRPKMGFGIPFGDWLRGDLQDLLQSTINKDNLRRHGLFNEDYVLGLKDAFLKGQNDKHWQLWLIFMFQLWWNEWMADAGTA